MAFSRKTLKAMGLTDEQVDSLVDMHTETVDALKEQRDSYKADAEKLAAVQAELDDLKAKGDDGFKEKYENEHRAFEDFKASQTAKETAAAKNSAVKAYFESNGITGANLNIAMRGVNNEISGIEMEDGKLKDTTALDELIKGDFAGLVGTVQHHGADVDNPNNNHQQSDLDKMSDEDFYKTVMKK